MDKEMGDVLIKNTSDKVVIVTGGSRGIGRSIVEELGGNNCNICSLDLECSIYNDVQYFNCDVANRTSVSQTISSIVEKYGRIDALINNAGITRDKTLVKMTDEDWHDVINVNLHGVYNTTKEVAPHMISAKWGRIINISSIVGQTGAFGQANYSASKAAVIGFSKSCALEFARHGITVNTICPGYVRTKMTENIPIDISENIAKKIPLGRFAEPYEIASIIRYLVFDKSDYITGQCINVNGGLPS